MLNIKLKKMKTKTFLLFCLFIGFVTIQLSAQNSNAEGTKSYAGFASGWWECPVYCNGVEVDYIAGSGDLHYVDHYKNGKIQYEILTMKGVGWSIYTDEEFTFKEQDMIWVPKEGFWLAHDNIRLAGEKGNLYNISLIINMDTWTTEIKNATCTGNSDY